MKYILLFSLLFFMRCSITPHFSQVAVDNVEKLGHDFDNLYDGLIADTDKTYATHEGEYTTIDAEISDLLILYAIRPKSKIITGMANDIRRRFESYEADHKSQGTLNNAKFLIYKNGMHALWASLHNSEINFKP